MKPSINRSIVKSHSKRWKQKKLAKVDNRKIAGFTQCENYIDLENKNEKNLKMFQLKQRKINWKIN